MGIGIRQRATTQGTTMKAVVQSALGGSDVLTIAEAPVPSPGDGEVLVDVELAGVNYSDIHGRRTGNNFLAAAQPPFVPGAEVVGTRRDTGERVVGLCSLGGFAEVAAVPEDRLHPLPADIPDALGLALLVQGLTAWHLIHSALHRVEGATIVVAGGAGGVGALCVQLARLAGARRVIALASTEDKRAAVRGLGADAAVDSRRSDRAQALQEAPGPGETLDAYLDIEAGETTLEVLGALAPMGQVVVYGSLAPAAGLLALPRLILGSKTVTGFWLPDHLRHGRDAFSGPLGHLYRLASEEALSPDAITVHPLAEAAVVLEQLEARQTTGKHVLRVGGGGGS